MKTINAVKEEFGEVKPEWATDHLDEKVNLAQMGGVNEFDRKIAEVRCANFFDNTVRLTKHYIGGIKFEGIYLLLGGDVFSGNIHEELKITNETTIIESLIYWVEPIAAGIRYRRVRSRTHTVRCRQSRPIELQTGCEEQNSGQLRLPVLQHAGNDAQGR